MDAVGLKVADVFHCCVDDRITNLRTFEMLAKIENCVSLLQESLERVPAETLDIIRKIKDKERRTRYGSMAIWLFGPVSFNLTVPPMWRKEKAYFQDPCEI